DELDLEPQLVSGEHGPPEAYALEAREHDAALGRQTVGRALGEKAAGLNKRLADEHARHDRPARKVPREEGLVRGHALHGHQPLPVGDFDDAIDEQKRITMRQVTSDVRVIESHDVISPPAAASWVRSCASSCTPGSPRR